MFLQALGTGAHYHLPVPVKEVRLVVAALYLMLMFLLPGQLHQDRS